MRCAGVIVKNWQKAAVVTLITLIAGGIYLFTVFEHRRKLAAVPNADENQGMTMDDLAVVRTKSIISFEGAKELEGTSVWMKNGYTIAYFPFEGGRVEFAKRVGVIPSAQRLDIKKVVKAAPPASVDDGISHGSRQIFAVFTMPGNPNQYATAIGVMDGIQEQYFCNLLFYYDDPHTIYDNWPKNIWAAVDAHQVIPGMNELQTRMSIGQNGRGDGSTEGNRTVTYDQGGKHWTVTFVNDKATNIKTD
jgi:hypothetical protein